jgi:hypothetical protein
MDLLSATKKKNKAFKKLKAGPPKFKDERFPAMILHKMIHFEMLYDSSCPKVLRCFVRYKSKNRNDPDLTIYAFYCSVCRQPSYYYAYKLHHPTKDSELLESRATKTFKSHADIFKDAQLMNYTEESDTPFNTPLHEVTDNIAFRGL